MSQSVVMSAPSQKPRLGKMSATGQDISMDSIRRRFSLDGEWTFQFGEEAPQSISVPAPWESVRPDLLNKAGTAIYEKRFSVPDGFVGNRLVLRFGAVDYFTEVWLDGKVIGTHEGGYTPFEFDVEDVIGRTGPNDIHTLLVRVT